MIYGSVCSGIEAATVAWEPLGMKASFFAEIEKFPSAVLRHHYPDTPNLGDFTKIGSDFGPVDILVVGTPCQSFSVAGKRAGLDDPRGNLAIEFLRLAQRLRARWLVWENVPGVLSSNGGRDFGTFLRLVGQCGYGFAYRVLDAQYFGVPQRRRRVFLVGYFGDWRPAASVLFERESLSWNPKPSREAGEELAGTLKGGTGERGYPDPSDGNGGGLIMPEIAFSLRANPSHSGDKGDGGVNTTLVPTLSGSGAGTARTGNERSEAGFLIPDLAYALKAHEHAGASNGQGGMAVTLIPELAGCVTTREGQRMKADQDTYIGYGLELSNQGSGGNTGWFEASSVSITLDASSPPGYAGKGVRRLTPRECERLQGFEDDFTLIPWRGKAREECPDGPRYRALGNSMAVPCMRWIGERIRQVNGLNRLLADVLRVEDGDDPVLFSTDGCKVNERAR